jgi:tetratricopeptide (TPR) repeat protein
MKTSLRLCLAALLFIGFKHSNAQAPLLLFGNSLNYTFKFGLNNQQGSPEITRYFIDALAQAAYKPAINTSYTVNFDQRLELQSINSYLQIDAQTSFIQPTGDVYYRNFYVGDLLLPTSINLLLNIVDERGGLLRSLQVSNLNKSNRYTTAINTNMIYVGNQKLSLQVVNMILFYDAQALNDFNYRTGIINDYYNTNMMLDNAQNELSTIVFVTPENVESTTATLQKVEQDINFIEAKKFGSVLQLSMQDPINLINRTAALRNVLVQKRMSVNMAYASLDSYYYSKGLEAFTNKNYVLAHSLFTKSLAINPIYAPSAYQLALLKFEEDKVLDADLKLREVWFKMNPDPNTYQNSLTLFKNIYNEYLETGDILANQGKYNDALEQYDRAQKLCREINGVQCNMAAKESIKRAHIAIYQSILNEAKNIAETGNNNEGYNKFNQAKNYAKENNLNPQDKSSEAVVEKALKFNEYKDAIKNAKADFGKSDFNAALAGFETAHDLEGKYSFSPSLIPLDTEQQAAKGVIKNKIDNLVELSNKNDWEGIKPQLSKVEEMQAFYKLTDDNEINNKKKQVKDKLKNYLCDIATRNFDEHIQKAKASVAANNFIMANEGYESALKIANENQDCNLNINAIADEKAAIIPPATYQKFINKILDLQLNGNYGEAVTKYKEALAYYQQYELNKFNITKKNLFDFAKDNFKNGALDFVANDFRKNGQIDEAFQLYKILLDRNYPVRNISDDLFGLGKSFGTRDKSTGTTDFEQKSKSYTGDDKKLKSFKKGYISAFEN